MFVLHRIDALADKLREAISLITCGCGRPWAAQFPDGPPPCFRSASTETKLEDDRLCSEGCDLQPDAIQIITPKKRMKQKSDVQGKSVSVRVDLGGCRIIIKEK